MGYYYLPMNDTVELASNIVISTFENSNLVSLKTRMNCGNLFKLKMPIFVDCGVSITYGKFDVISV